MRLLQTSCVALLPTDVYYSWMHELAITEQILRMVNDRAAEAGAKAVTRVRLVVGAGQGYAGESIRMYFGMMSEGTLCEGAELEYEMNAGCEFYIDNIEVKT